MLESKQLLDDLERVLQSYNDLNDQVLIVYEDDPDDGFDDSYDEINFAWRANYPLPA
jgi:hypothetical protein